MNVFTSFAIKLWNSSCKYWHCLSLSLRSSFTIYLTLQSALVPVVSESVITVCLSLHHCCVIILEQKGAALAIHNIIMVGFWTLLFGINLDSAQLLNTLLLLMT